MTFPTSWVRKQEIIIDVTKIGTDSGGTPIIDFPVLVTEAHLGIDVLDGCLFDGSDLRFTTDELGTGICPRDIEAIDKLKGTIRVHVKILTLSNTNFKLWVWYGNQTAEAPIDDANTWLDNFMPSDRFSHSRVPTYFDKTDGFTDFTTNQWYNGDATPWAITGNRAGFIHTSPTAGELRYPITLLDIGAGGVDFDFRIDYDLPVAPSSGTLELRIQLSNWSSEPGLWFRRSSNGATAAVDVVGGGLEYYALSTGTVRIARNDGVTRVWLWSSANNQWEWDGGTSGLTCATNDTNTYFPRLVGNVYGSPDGGEMYVDNIYTSNGVPKDTNWVATNNETIDNVSVFATKTAPLSTIAPLTITLPTDGYLVDNVDVDKTIGLPTQWNTLYDGLSYKAIYSVGQFLHLRTLKEYPDEAPDIGYGFPVATGAISDDIDDIGITAGDDPSYVRTYITSAGIVSTYVPVPSGTYTFTISQGGTSNIVKKHSSMFSRILGYSATLGFNISNQLVLEYFSGNSAFAPFANLTKDTYSFPSELVPETSTPQFFEAVGIPRCSWSLPATAKTTIVSDSFDTVDTQYWETITGGAATVDTLNFTYNNTDQSTDYAVSNISPLANGYTGDIEMEFTVFFRSNTVGDSIVWPYWWRTVGATWTQQGPQIRCKPDGTIWVPGYSTGVADWTLPTGTAFLKVKMSRVISSGEFRCWLWLNNRWEWDGDTAGCLLASGVTEELNIVNNLYTYKSSTFSVDLLYCKITHNSVVEIEDFFHVKDSSYWGFNRTGAFALKNENLLDVSLTNSGTGADIGVGADSPVITSAEDLDINVDVELDFDASSKYVVGSATHLRLALIGTPYYIQLTNGYSGLSIDTQTDSYSTSPVNFTRTSLKLTRTNGAYTFSYFDGVSWVVSGTFISTAPLQIKLVAYCIAPVGTPITAVQFMDNFSVNEVVSQEGYNLVVSSLDETAPLVTFTEQTLAIALVAPLRSPSSYRFLASDCAEFYCLLYRPVNQSGTLAYTIYDKYDNVFNSGVISDQLASSDYGFTGCMNYREGSRFGVEFDVFYIRNDEALCRQQIRGINTPTGVDNNDWTADNWNFTAIDTMLFTVSLRTKRISMSPHSMDKAAVLMHTSNNDLLAYHVRYQNDPPPIADVWTMPKSQSAHIQLESHKPHTYGDKILFSASCRGVLFGNIYDTSSNSWLTPFRVRLSSMFEDAHAMPVANVDKQGYIWVISGGRGDLVQTGLFLAKSSKSLADADITNILDISTWSQAPQLSVALRGYKQLETTDTGYPVLFTWERLHVQAVAVYKNSAWLPLICIFAGRVSDPYPNKMQVNKSNTLVHGKTSFNCAPFYNNYNSSETDRGYQKLYFRLYVNEEFSIVRGYRADGTEIMMPVVGNQNFQPSPTTGISDGGLDSSADPNDYFCQYDVIAVYSKYTNLLEWQASDATIQFASRRINKGNLWACMNLGAAYDTFSGLSIDLNKWTQLSGQTSQSLVDGKLDFNLAEDVMESSLEGIEKITGDFSILLNINMFPEDGVSVVGDSRCILRLTAIDGSFVEVTLIMYAGGIGYRMQVYDSTGSLVQSEPYTGYKGFPYRRLWLKRVGSTITLAYNMFGSSKNAFSFSSLGNTVHTFAVQSTDDLTIKLTAIKYNTDPHVLHFQIDSLYHQFDEMGLRTTGSSDPFPASPTHRQQVNDNGIVWQYVCPVLQKGMYSEYSFPIETLSGHVSIPITHYISNTLEDYSMANWDGSSWSLTNIPKSTNPSIRTYNTAFNNNDQLLIYRPWVPNNLLTSNDYGLSWDTSTNPNLTLLGQSVAPYSLGSSDGYILNVSGASWLGGSYSMLLGFQTALNQPVITTNLFMGQFQGFYIGA